MKSFNRRSAKIFLLLAALLAVGCIRVKDLKPEPLGMNCNLVNANTKGEIKIVRDENYLPHIIADNDEDVYYGLGFAMAQDRFAQMDVARKVAEGRLSELLGHTPSYHGINLVTMDVLMRTFGYWEDSVAGYKAMNPKDKALLDAFTNGVNRYLKEVKDNPPFEVATLKVGLEPWRPEDSLAAMGLYGLAMTIDCLFGDYYSDRLISKIGKDRAMEFIEDYPSTAPIITAGYENEESINALKSLKKIIDEIVPHPVGSNNWVVGSSRSAAGKALLANDPHVPLPNIPTFWYHCHLKCPSFDVMGMIFPAFPGFGAGYNGKVAWGLTNVMADYIDLYKEKVNPQNPNQYQYKGQWENFQVVTGEIKINGRKNPVKYSYRVSRHGPIIETGMVGKYKVRGWATGEVMAVKTIDLLMGTFMSGYFDFPKVADWRQFRAACAKISVGTIGWNHVYADRQGNIGYQTTANIPIRADNQGYLMHEGWTGEGDWIGYVPFGLLPHLYNPQKGYILTANNKVADDDYPFYISNSYAPFRATRINEFLSSKTSLTAKDMMELQADAEDIHARESVPYFIEDLADSSNPDFQKVRKILIDWQKSGFHDNVDEIAPSIYYAMFKFAPYETFSDELGKSLTEAITGGMSMAGLFLLQRIMPDPQNKWFDDVKTPQRETRKDITNRSLKKGLKWVKSVLGPDMNKWQWGKFHTITFGHVLNIVPKPFLRDGDQLKRGPYPANGGLETVNSAAAFPLKKSGYHVFLGPSSRFIVDFATPEFAYISASTGMSSNPVMPNYDNLTQTWLKNEYVKMYFSEEEFRKNNKGEMTIKP